MLSVYHEFGDVPLQLDRAFWKRSVGPKAFFLSQLFQAGIPVPAGIILRSCPLDAAAWKEVVGWWKRSEQRLVVVRSSAAGEDSSHQTFLNINTEAGLKEAVVRCFAAIGDQEPAVNVVIQRMVAPLSAGVYFSADPSDDEAGWLLEWVDTDTHVASVERPRRVRAENARDSAIAHVLLPVVGRVERLLQFPVDVEWAIDREGQPWILQVRPTAVQRSGDRRSRATRREIARLTKRHVAETSWDGRAFAEWTGVPSELSFSIWARAFGSGGSLGAALRSTGYLGSGFGRRSSALDRVLGRPYVNQRRMDDLLFGESVFTTALLPKPHLQIARDRLNAQMLLQSPMAAFYMARAAWRSAGSGRSLLRDCRDAYAREVLAAQLPNDPSMYRSEDLPSLLAQLEAAANDFTDRQLHWPMVLMLLVQRSTGRLRELLAKSVPPNQIDAFLERSLSHTINPAAFEMDRQYQVACYNVPARSHFLREFGHRARGEMDLASPRWIERGDGAFTSPQRSTHSQRSRTAAGRPPTGGQDDVKLMPGVYRPLIVEETARLREMLALRESWNDLVMRPYAHLRWMAVEIGRRTGLNDRVFDLRVAELRQAARGPQSVPRLRRLARLRAESRRNFSDVHLPVIVTLDALRTLDDGASADSLPSATQALAVSEERLKR
jgi:hypothetical protein